jgi:hypothetical protein
MRTRRGAAPGEALGAVPDVQLRSLQSTRIGALASGRALAAAQVVMTIIDAQ